MIEIQNTENINSWKRYRTSGTLLNSWLQCKMEYPLWKKQYFTKYLKHMPRNSQDHGKKKKVKSEKLLWPTEA